MKILAIIPIRKNSKRIKNKNFIEINKKKLFKHTLDEACKCKYIDNVILATDLNSNKEKKKLNLQKNNKKIKVFHRSKKSATSTAPTEMVIEEVLKKNFCDWVILIQATNIFLKSEYLNKAVEKLVKYKEYDTLLSVVNSKYFIWGNKNKKNKNQIISKNYNFKYRPRSQDFKNQEYIENGSFYIFNRKKFLIKKNRLYGKITYFEMPKVSILEIDDNEDLKLVRKLKN